LTSCSEFRRESVAAIHPPATFRQLAAQVRRRADGETAARDSSPAQGSERARFETRFTRVQGRENVNLQLQVVWRDERQRRLFCELTHVVRRSSG